MAFENLKILVDMSLSPAWTAYLRGAGWQTVHWSEVGDPRAADSAIMQFAREQGYLVFTHDLDFGAILAHTQAGTPSVFQVRAQEVTPKSFGTLVILALRQFTNELNVGALVTVDATRRRVRLLPLIR